MFQKMKLYYAANSLRKWYNEENLLLYFNTFKATRRVLVRIVYIFFSLHTLNLRGGAS